MEKSCRVSRHFIELSAKVAEKLEDNHYVTKLLESAEQLLDSANFDFCQYRELVETIDRTTRDANWLRGLFQKMSGRTRHFSETNQIVKLALGLEDREL